MAGGIFKSRKTAAIIIVALISVFLVSLCGCAESTERRQAEYKSRWKEVMNEFEDRVAVDDEKAQKMIDDNETAGVIRLLGERIKNVWQVYDEIVVLYPPDDLRRLHALTLYYMTTVVDQLEAQNDLNEAIISGKPTEDLKTIADEAAQKSAFVIGQLALEIEKADIRLKSMEKPGPQVQEQQQGTTPSGNDGNDEE
ncbi:MAG: hypothetical protein JXA49_02530 [Actinobacteria bacterium]|nr:hypothetical protein [Actinomycetota bacterium]